MAVTRAIDKSDKQQLTAGCKNTASVGKAG